MTVIGAMGVGIQLVTVPLFVRDRVSEDHRAIAISLALVCQMLPSAVLLLVGGVIADRIERRRIMIRVYIVAAAVSCVYVFLSKADFSGIWPVFFLGATIGAVDAFGQPARISMAPAILPQAQLQNGIILSTVAFMAAGMFMGPAVGGLLADGAGLTVAFSAEVAFLVIAALLSTRIGTDKPVPTGKTIRGDLVDGLRYVRGASALKWLLLFQMVPGLFLIGPFRVTAVLMVNDVLAEPDKYVGLFSACFGVGVLMGSFLMTLRHIPNRGKVLCGAPILGGVTFIAYAASEMVTLSMAILVFWGLGAAIFINLATPLIQEASSRPMIGRVMSMSNLAFAIATPLGLIQSGLLASAFGPQVAVTVSGVVCTVIGVLALIFLKPVRSLP